MSDEQIPKPEHVRVIFPNPLEMANLRDYPAEIIRAVAQAANECGLEGKRLEGLIFTTNPGRIDPEVVFEVRQLQPEPVPVHIQNAISGAQLRHLPFPQSHE